MYMLSGCELIDTENISLPSQNMKLGGEWAKRTSHKLHILFSRLIFFSINHINIRMTCLSSLYKTKTRIFVFSREKSHDSKYASPKHSSYVVCNYTIHYIPIRREGAILQSACPLVRPSVRLTVRSHFRNRYLSFYWKKWLHIYFLFTVRLTNERVGVFLARHVACNILFLQVYINVKIV
jgi:hypothetical protein